MDHSPFSDSVWWHRIKKLAALSNILAVVVAIAWFAYTIWHDRVSQAQANTGPEEGPSMSLWTPTYAIGAALLLTATIYLIAAIVTRNRGNKHKTEIEIVSPFDGEKVNLCEIVRGRVFPPDTPIQVLVFAGDKKWYPQGPVSVIGSLWSVKCQFGNQDGPGGGAYKVAAVLGTELKQGMWYETLPNGVKSNIVHLQKNEITIEQKLSTALKEAKDANLKVNEERGTKEGIYTLYNESERKLASVAWLIAMANEQAKDISSYVVAKIISYPNAGELVLEGKELCVVVGVSIRNESVFEINITDKDMTGSFSDGKTFAEPATILKDQLRGPIEGLKPLSSQLLVLEQPLRQSEAERIRRSLADQTVKIDIGDVRLLISSQNASIPVDPKPLLLSDRGGKIPLSDFKCNTKSLDSTD